MKTVCVYHSIDLDGWMSAAIVKYWFMSDESNFKIGAREKDGFLEDAFLNVNSIEFIGYNYGQPIPDLFEYDKVIMCDISFPKEIMEVLFASLRENFIWCDHHISAINDSKKMYFSSTMGLRDTKFAACELTWKYFFPNKPMPEIVRLLGRYDCFGSRGTDEETKVLEFQYGARMVISNYEEAYDYLTQCTRTKESEYWRLQAQVVVGQILGSGQAVYAYLCTDAKQSYKNGFEIRFSNPAIIEFFESEQNKLKFICINKERFNPINFGIDYHKDGYDGAACFHIDSTGTYCFSLYNDNGEVNCSAIAREYGGGGHAGASGMRLNTTDFLKLING